MAQSQDLRYHLAPNPQVNESLPVPMHHAASAVHFSGWNEYRIIRGSGLGGDENVLEWSTASTSRDRSPDTSASLFSAHASTVSQEIHQRHPPTLLFLHFALFLHQILIRGERG
jgi:hypothetical protein